MGRKRIGLAGCDALGLTVTPLPALRRARYPADLEQLRQLVNQRRITALVVGLPLDAQQQPTEQAEHCRRYGERLARHLELPLALVNEYASSWSAAERHGLHGDRSGALDSAAAALLRRNSRRPESTAVLVCNAVSIGFVIQGSSRDRGLSSA